MPAIKATSNKQLEKLSSNQIVGPTGLNTPGAKLIKNLVKLIVNPTAP